MNQSAYSKYYKAKLETALVFQDFVVDAAWSLLGLAIVQYGSRAYQNAVGESRTGVEIKHDEKFSVTGNLWIEAGEKAQPREGDYFPSGIYREDNTWLYCIGDYDTIFFFQKTLLRGLYESGRYEKRENKTRTSVGFLLPKKDAERYAAVILRPNAKEKIQAVANDLAEIGRIAHQAVLTPVGQASLFEDAA